MQGIELANHINNIASLKNNFIGVFAINTLPKKLKKRHFFFCNTDIDSGVGKHWQCIVKNDENNLELFDSLGVTETKLQNLAAYLKLKSKTLLYNETAVQLSTSSTCGYFCLYFAIYRLLNIDLDFDDVMNNCFTKNLELNENNVAEFFKDNL